jgi:Uma2 family endonuclease
MPGECDYNGDGETWTGPPVVMKATVMSSPLSTTLEPEPRPRRWTREEYHRMVELGLFHDQRIELIDGEILEMSPQEAAHFATIARLQKVLAEAFGAGYWVRAQGPLVLANHSEPEPDIAVVEGTIDDYSDHPRTALLVVEVSHTTLTFDRRDKGSLYAAAGIAEYWIVNLNDRQLEVHRGPQQDVAQRFGFGFRDRQILKATEAVSPLALQQASIRVADFLS